jgi:hypothetical protein
MLILSTFIELAYHGSSYHGRKGLSGISSGLAGGLGYSVVVRLPPRPVARGEVGAGGGMADGAVDELADEVGVAGVAAGLDGDPDQGVVQGDLVLVGRPPGDAADGVQRQGVDGGVGVGPGPALQAGDRLA